MRPGSVRRASARAVMLGVMLVVAMGCAEGGGSGGGQGGTAEPAVVPVDLEPGQTSAVLAWEPSAGDVDTYFVLESRDEGAFAFSAVTSAPEVEITGEPGDSVRIQVIAVAASGALSAPSVPSVPVRFYAAEGASAATAATNGPGATPSATAAVIASTTPDAQESADSASDALASENDADDESEDSEVASSENADDTDEATTDEPEAIDRLIREHLLAADLRFPFRTHSPDVQQWLQGHADGQIGQGLSLVGTGDANGDRYRELIFADQSGQLFVSDGAGLASTTGEASGTEPIEAIRLHATERFLALADFDGDLIGDWLIEEVATEVLWIIDGASQETRSVAIAIDDRASTSAAASALAGHGDFDGDGRSELLWQFQDGSYATSTASSAPAELAWLVTSEQDEADLNGEITSSQLLSVADLDGDGRDDLLLLGQDGRTRSAVSATGGGLTIATSRLSERPTEGLQLIATLDIDGDGLGEIAWHDGADVVLWSPSDAL